MRSPGALQRVCASSGRRIRHAAACRRRRVACHPPPARPVPLGTAHRRPRRPLVRRELRTTPAVVPAQELRRGRTAPRIRRALNPPDSSPLFLEWGRPCLGMTLTSLLVLPRESTARPQLFASLIVPRCDHQLTEAAVWRPTGTPVSVDYLLLERINGDDVRKIFPSSNVQIGTLVCRARGRLWHATVHGLAAWLLQPRRSSSVCVVHVGQRFSAASTKRRCAVPC